MPIYDVENRFSYYKNYSDNILVGPAKPTIGSSVWQRSVSGSVVSGSEEYKAATFLSDYLFELNNRFFRSGEVRYLRLQSTTQQIEDSIAPSPIQLYATGTYASGVLGGPNGSFTPELTNGASLLFSTDREVITGSIGDGALYVGLRINNVEWLDSYPYEKKYAYVDRGITSVLPPGTTYGVYPKGQTPGSDELLWLSFDGAATFDTIPYTIYFTSIATNDTKYYNEFAERTGIDGTFPDADSSLSFTSNNIKLTAKSIFGIKATPTDIATSLSVVGSVLNFCSGVYIEGWKYGLYNGLPTNFSCVFRQNHYGQPRDMLEGRPYTKTYNNKEIGGPMDTDGGINFISGSALSGESNNYLTASIYQSKNVTAAYTVNPYGSGIFDKEYRASQPWHDDDPRVGT